MVIFISNTEEYVEPDPFGEEIPVGAVVLWYGSLSQLASEAPDYHLCDGSIISGSTLPDLRRKFVMGASSGDELLTTGGAETHFHASGGVSSAGGHEHSFDGFSTGAAGTYTYVTNGTDSYPKNTHYHNVAGGNSSNGGNHNHSWSGTSGYASSIPTHKRLYYIMRVQ